MRKHFGRVSAARAPRSGEKTLRVFESIHSVVPNIKTLTSRSRFVFPNQRNHETAIRTESLNKAIRLSGYDTKTQHCAHGFRALAYQVRDTLGNAYNRTKYLPERVDMMQCWGDYLDQLKRQALSGNVITASFGQAE